MSKVYARTNTVPDGCDYITPGKLYEANEEGCSSFLWHDDKGLIRGGYWRRSSHLHGGDWERVELSEEAPPSRYQLLTIEELEADLSAIECALQAKRAEETDAMIDG
jgi:hypothetical protein